MSVRVIWNEAAALALVYFGTVVVRFLEVHSVRMQFSNTNGCRLYHS